MKYASETIRTDSGEWTVQVLSSGEVLILDAQGDLRGQFCNAMMVGLHLAMLMAKADAPGKE